MNRRADIVKQLLRDALGKSLDEPLLNDGFKRGVKSFSYTRKNDRSIQKIVFNHDLRPSTGEDVRISPSIWIELPDLVAVITDMVSGDIDLVGRAPGLMLNQPISICAPFAEQRTAYAKGALEIDQSVAEIASFLRQWVLPLLDELGNPDDLLRIYETNADVLMKQQHFYIQLAAAAYVERSPMQALGILERHLGTAGLKKRYAAAYDFLT